MSGYESANSLNLTLLQSDESRPGLTNGQIAAITIVTIFVFFMTMMVVVCAGEYWKYINGKKKKPVLQRQRHAASAMTNVREERAANQLQIPIQPESSFSQSDFITTSSLKDSDSSGESNHRHRHSSGIDVISSKVGYNNTFTIGQNMTLNSEDSLDPVHLDCVDACDESDLKSEDDVTMVPLILQQCDDTIEMDGDIYCDSIESRDQFQLEADV